MHALPEPFVYSLHVGTGGTSTNSRVKFTCWMCRTVARYVSSPCLPMRSSSQCPDRASSRARTKRITINTADDDSDGGNEEYTGTKRRRGVNDPPKTQHTTKDDNGDDDSG